MADGRLVVAVELKSHVGPSFGNNFNNRAEEAIGNAEDIWTAYRQGLFGQWPPPFVGYLFILEDCNAVHAKRSLRQPYFSTDPVFEASSYAKRYEVLFSRLLLERKYTAACLALATEDGANVQFPAPALSFRTFAGALEGYAHGVVNSAR